MKKRKTEVAIVGAGTAGLNARRKVATRTDDYLVIDGGELGTTCAREGCMPSKDLLAEANAAYYFKKFQSEYDFAASDSPHRALPAILKKIRRRRDEFVDSVLESMSGWARTHFIAKDAEFLDANTLSLGDEIIEAEHIIVATGSRPHIPQEWKDFSKWVLTSDSLFELTALPRRIAVVGLGTVGLELAQALARLGVEVHGFSAERGIGHIESPQLQRLAEETFAKEFHLHLERATPRTLQGNVLELLSGSESLEFEKVLLAVGRQPNVGSLNLARLGLPLDSNGMPPLGENGLHVKGTSIYIIGDANSERPVLHEARFEAEAAVDMIFRSQDKITLRPPKLEILFTDPQICRVGLSLSEITNRNLSYETLSVSLEKSGRALIENDGVGMIEVYIERESGKILGAELLCRAAEHLGHLLALSIQKELTAYDLLEMPFYHPTLEESLRNIVSRFAGQYPKKQTDSVSSLEITTPHPRPLEGGFA